MLEPIETESKENLDALMAALERIAEPAESESGALNAAPKSTPVGRLNEVEAAHKPDLSYRVGPASARGLP